MGISNFYHLAFADKVSSRAAQLAIQEAPSKDAATLASGLRGHVRVAMRSMYANYVLQKIVEMLPAASHSFVVEELTGFGSEAARHRFGCRILCRILEHGTLDDGRTAKLLQEVLTDIESLCRHTYGNYVIATILEFGLIEHRQKVANVLSTGMCSLAKNRSGSRIIERALRFCSVEDQCSMIDAMLGDRDEFVLVAEHQFGCHVVKAMLRMSGVHQHKMVNYLRPEIARLNNSKYGKHVVEVLDTVMD